MALCTIEDIYKYKSESYDPSTNVLKNETYDMLIDAVSSKIETICNRKFEAADYTEYQNGEGSKFCLLDNFPVNSVSAVKLVYIDDKEINIDLDDIDIDYETGELYYQTSIFPSGIRNIKIEYNGGYNDIPDDLKLISVKMICDEEKSNNLNTNYKSEKLGDYSYSIRTDLTVEDSTMNKLKQYIRYY